MSKTKEMVAEPKTENLNAEGKPEEHEEMTEEQRESICYKSKLLNKYFDTYAELKEAEKKYHEENDTKLKLAEEKKARAEEIKTLKQKALDARKSAQAMIKEADDAYYKAREKFIEDYGYYHESYYSDGEHEVVTISDVIDSFFKPWF